MAAASRTAKPLRVRRCQWWHKIIHRLPRRPRRSHRRMRRSRATSGPAADRKPHLANDVSPPARQRTTARVGLDELNELSCKLFDEARPVTAIKGILKRPQQNLDGFSSWFKYSLGPQPSSGQEVGQEVLGRELLQLEYGLRREQAWSAELLRRLAMYDEQKWEYGAARAAAKVPPKCRWPPRYIGPARDDVEERLGRLALDWWFL